MADDKFLQETIFFEDAPVLTETDESKCPVCGKKKTWENISDCKSTACSERKSIDGE